MQSKYDTHATQEQEMRKLSQETVQLLEVFLSPLLLVLDRTLDKRLVRTFVDCCVAILHFRNNKYELLLSELGSYIEGYQGLSRKATAGTKRVGNLLRSIKWSICSLDHYLMEEADKEVKRLKEQGERILCLWDASVIEKPESRVAEGLCPVVSSKAKRLNRSRRGLVFNMPAARPVMVTGMHWTSAIIAGMHGTIRVAAMSWWMTKGDYATKTRKQEEELLRKVVRKWGDLLIHVFDRGYASGPWIQLLQSFRVTFVIRWMKGHFFLNTKGEEKKLWQIGLGKKYLDHKLVYDTNTGEKIPCDIWWTPVWHASYDYQLYLVKVRGKKKVWYLITNERVKTANDAWALVFTYKRRWQIETSFRYGKCELALESPRLWAFENRLKLLGIVTIVYAFLLDLLNPTHKELVKSLLQAKCHRTGKRCREALVPLYRLRWAMSRLWDDHHPILGSVFPPNIETIEALSLFRG